MSKNWWEESSKDFAAGFSEEVTTHRSNPPYSIKTPEQEQAWWQWADQASDQALLTALHGCASWSEIAATVCLTRLEDRGYTLYNSAQPASVTIERETC